MQLLTQNKPIVGLNPHDGILLLPPVIGVNLLVFMSWDRLRNKWTKSNVSVGPKYEINKAELIYLRIYFKIEYAVSFLSFSNYNLWIFFGCSNLWPFGWSWSLIKWRRFKNTFSLDRSDWLGSIFQICHSLLYNRGWTREQLFAPNFNHNSFNPFQASISWEKTSKTWHETVCALNIYWDFNIFIDEYMF